MEEAGKTKEESLEYAPVIPVVVEDDDNIGKLSRDNSRDHEKLISSIKELTTDIDFSQRIALMNLKKI